MSQFAVTTCLGVSVMLLAIGRIIDLKRADQLEERIARLEKKR